MAGHEESVTKLDAARRHMNEAIRMLFAQCDPLAIHTLACAATQVLSDLCKARGIPSLLRGADGIRQERRKEWIDAIKRAENFFKHADRTPDEVLVFNREQTEIVLLEAGSLYWQLTRHYTFEGFVYYLWASAKYPDLIPDGEYKSKVLEFAAAGHIPADDLGFFAKVVKARHLMPPIPGVVFD